MRIWGGMALGIALACVAGCHSAGPAFDPDEDLLQVRPERPAADDPNPSATVANPSPSPQPLGWRAVPRAVYTCPASTDAATWKQRVTDAVRCPYCAGACVPRLERVETPPATEVAGPR